MEIAESPELACPFAERTENHPYEVFLGTLQLPRGAFRGFGGGLHAGGNLRRKDASLHVQFPDDRPKRRKLAGEVNRHENADHALDHERVRGADPGGDRAAAMRSAE
jgi:hypothetical protein